MTMENINDYQVQDGDIRKVRRVEIKDDWDSPEQIAHPVSEEKVQAYLKNKSDKPMMLPKWFWLCLPVFWFFMELFMESVIL